MLENFNDPYHASRLHGPLQSFAPSHPTNFLDWDDTDMAIGRVQHFTDLEVRAARAVLVAGEDAPAVQLLARAALSKALAGRRHDRLTESGAAVGSGRGLRGVHRPDRRAGSDDALPVEPFVVDVPVALALAAGPGHTAAHDGHDPSVVCIESDRVAIFFGLLQWQLLPRPEGCPNRPGLTDAS